MRNLLLGCAILGGSALVSAQSAPENWFNLDSEKDKVRGVSTERAYSELLQGKPSTEVIVAVIDGGVDYTHEDLKRVMWVNEKEIPNNGIDDDKNGYIDDIHGWNFIGGMKNDVPTHVDGDNLEVTRVYASLLPKYLRMSAKEGKKANKEEYALYLETKKTVEESLNSAISSLVYFTGIKDQMMLGAADLKKAMGVTEITEENLKGFKTEDEALLKVKGGLESIYGAIGYFTSQKDFYYNPLLNTREIVGDVYLDTKNRSYGNNDIKGPDSSHGTHVAGTIGADRTNDIGMDGVADNVRIMGIRVVPGGDERDKDVANGVYYAVDNGAKIINMSFGKAYSSDKDYVDAAFKYASDKGVLIVHAAGNSGENIDDHIHYPNDIIKGTETTFATWLDIGASDWGDNNKFAADFSNYGKATVDLFAPGVDIYATWPEQEYKAISGTSMATPVVAGVAALVWSRYPNLTAVQLKEILIKSATNYSDEKVNMPGTRTRNKEGVIESKSTKFGKLSVSGSIVNAYEALKLADTYK